MLLVIFLAMVIIIAYIYSIFREGFSASQTGCQGIDSVKTPHDCQAGPGNICTPITDSDTCMETTADSAPTQPCCQWVQPCNKIPDGAVLANLNSHGGGPLVDNKGCYGNPPNFKQGDGSDIVYGTWQNYNDICCQSSCHVTLSDNLQWDDTKSGCLDGTVQSGEQCNVKCAPGWTAQQGTDTSAFYTCKNGKTTPSSLTCVANPPCTLPSTTVFNNKGWATTDPTCKPDGSLEPGKTCNISCIHGSKGGPTQFKCKIEGTHFLDTPTNACKPPPGPGPGPGPGPSPGPGPGPACLSTKYGCCADGTTPSTSSKCGNCQNPTGCGGGGDCTYSAISDTLNFMSGETNGCNLAGGTLKYNTTCTLQCEPNYISSGTGEIDWHHQKCQTNTAFTCTKPQGSCDWWTDKCPQGQTVNPQGTCNTVSCDQSADIASCCTPASSCDGVCTDAGWISNGNNYCANKEGVPCGKDDCCVQQCTMLSQTDWETNHWTSIDCKAGEPFTDNCTLTCAPGFVPSSPGNPPATYKCQNGNLIPPTQTLECKPGAGACTIPQLPENTVAIDDARCGPGRVLGAGQTCSIECNMATNKWVSSGPSEYICSETGSKFDAIPDLTCTLPKCSDNKGTICNNAKWMQWDQSEFGEKACTGAQGCTPEDCCNEAYTCVAHECDSGTIKKKNAPQYCTGITGCDNSECCEDIPNGDCSLFGCGGGYHPSDGTCQGACTQHDCCTPNPTCADTKANGGYECDVANGEVAVLHSVTCKGTQCTAQDCCQIDGQCNKFTCPTGSSALHNPPPVCAEAKCLPGECCQENPVCTDEACGGGWVLKPDSSLPTHCDGLTCTQSECCVHLATCDNVKCQTGSTKKGVPPPFCRSTFCTNDECCVTNNRCEPSLCGEGSHIKPILPDYCQKEICSTAECCDSNPTCANFYCGPGQRVANSNHICQGFVCENTECCTDNITCDTYSGCPAGRTFKKNYQDLVCREDKCTDADCCDPLPLPTCQNYTCPSRMKLKGNSNEIKCAGVACVDDECCIAEPKPTCFGAKYVCPPNFTPRANSQNITCEDYTCRTNECCNPNAKCETINCPEDMVPKSGNIICEGDTCKPQECCTAKATCQNFLCANGFQITDPKYTCRNALCQFDECCELVPPGPPKKRTTIRRTDARNYFGGTDLFDFEEEKKTANQKSRQKKEERRRYLQKHYQQREKSHKEHDKKHYGHDIQFNLLTPIPYSDAFAVEGAKQNNVEPSLARLTFADLP